MGTLAVLDPRAGDTTIGWDPNDPDSIEQAQATFDSLTAKGHIAYKVTKEGTKSGEQITKFDPKLEKIILAPQLKGG
jgi:hypothetical protein